MVTGILDIDSSGIISYLQDGEVLQHAVHHVLLRQVLQLQDEVDHVLAHGTPVQLVHEPPPLEPGVLCLHLLHHLLPKGADLGGALDRHVFVTFIPGMEIMSFGERSDLVSSNSAYLLPNKG